MCCRASRHTRTVCLFQRVTPLYSSVPFRLYTSDVIPPPTLEGEAKKYTPKIEKLVTEISQLTLVEVADLNELLKVSLNLLFVKCYLLNVDVH